MRGGGGRTAGEGRLAPSLLLFSGAFTPGVGKIGGEEEEAREKEDDENLPDEDGGGRIRGRPGLPGPVMLGDGRRAEEDDEKLPREIYDDPSPPLSPSLLREDGDREEP